MLPPSNYWQQRYSFWNTQANAQGRRNPITGGPSQSFLPSMNTKHSKAHIIQTTQALLQSVPQTLRFDKIALWEAFTEQAEQILNNAKKQGHPVPSIEKCYQKFHLDEKALLRDRSYGPKARGICSGHAKYIQNQLSKQGIKSDIVGKKRAHIPHFDHALLAIHGKDDGKPYLILVDPFQNPDLIEISHQKPPYGTPINGFQRYAQLSPQNGVIIQEQDPKTQQTFISHIVTQSRLLHPETHVAKCHMKHLHKLPWTAHNDENLQEGIVNADLNTGKITIKLPQEDHSETVTLDDIQCILETPKQARDALAPFIEPLPKKFGMSPCSFWTRLKQLLETESRLGFWRHLHQP